MDTKQLIAELEADNQQSNSTADLIAELEADQQPYVPRYAQVKDEQYGHMALPVGTPLMEYWITNRLAKGKGSIIESPEPDPNAPRQTKGYQEYDIDWDAQLKRHAFDVGKSPYNPHNEMPDELPRSLRVALDQWAGSDTSIAAKLKEHGFNVANNEGELSIQYGKGSDWYRFDPDKWGDIGYEILGMAGDAVTLVPQAIATAKAYALGGGNPVTGTAAAIPAAAASGAAIEGAKELVGQKLGILPEDTTAVFDRMGNEAKWSTVGGALPLAGPALKAGGQALRTGAVKAGLQQPLSNLGRALEAPLRTIPKGAESVAGWSKAAASKVQGLRDRAAKVKVLKGGVKDLNQYYDDLIPFVDDLVKDPKALQKLGQSINKSNDDIAKRYIKELAIKQNKSVDDLIKADPQLAPILATDGRKRAHRLFVDKIKTTVLDSNPRAGYVTAAQKADALDYLRNHAQKDLKKGSFRLKTPLGTAEDYGYVANTLEETVRRLDPLIKAGMAQGRLIDIPQGIKEVLKKGSPIGKVAQQLTEDSIPKGGLVSQLASPAVRAARGPAGAIGLGLATQLPYIEDIPGANLVGGTLGTLGTLAAAGRGLRVAGPIAERTLLKGLNSRALNKVLGPRPINNTSRVSYLGAPQRPYTLPVTPGEAAVGSTITAESLQQLLSSVESTSALNDIGQALDRSNNGAIDPADKFKLLNNREVRKALQDR